MRMQDKVAVITGGCSGIGKRTVERFLEEGGRAVIADIQDAAGMRLAETLGPAARFIHCDVRQEADIAAAVALADATWGRLDLMFNNAGLPGDPNPIETMPAEAWDATMAVLLRSVMLGIKHAIPVMRRQGGGAIVNTASVAGLMPGSTATAYSVAKNAVIQLSKCAALEVAGDGIRVNCICPGVIATPIFGRSAGLPTQLDAKVAEEASRTAGAMHPIGREGRADDIADGVLYLADDRAGFVTGIALTIDGGLAAGMTPGQRTALWAPLREAVGALAGGE